MLDLSGMMRSALCITPPWRYVDFSSRRVIGQQEGATSYACAAEWAILHLPMSRIPMKTEPAPAAQTERAPRPEVPRTDTPRQPSRAPPKTKAPQMKMEIGGGSSQVPRGDLLALKSMGFEEVSYAVCKFLSAQVKAIEFLKSAPSLSAAIHKAVMDILCDTRTRMYSQHQQIYRPEDADQGRHAA